MESSRLCRRVASQRWWSRGSCTQGGTVAGVEEASLLPPAKRGGPKAARDVGPSLSSWHPSARALWELMFHPSHASFKCLRYFCGLLTPEQTMLVSLLSSIRADKIQ